MSKKKKYRYLGSGMKVVNVGETITFNKNWEENHMESEWFYLDDISWYMSVDGRIVAPVAGIVKHLGVPKEGCRALSISIAEQCIVDVAPFGKCYEKGPLDTLWDKFHINKESASESEKLSENGAEFVNCQKFSEDSEEAKSDEAENG